MRAGAQAEVGDAPPIGAVVHGLEAGPGEIGDLVMVEAGPGHPFAQAVILPPASLFRSLGVAPFGNLFGQGAVLFDGKLVGRKVLRLQRKCLIQRGFPLRVGQLRQTEDQVDAHIPHARFPEDAHRLPRPCGIVPAVHPSEDAVIETLHPHADPVYAHLQQPPHISRSLLHHILRIHLHRKLRKQRFRGATALLILRDGGAGNHGVAGTLGICSSAVTGPAVR